jgi:hypothetical protein
MKDGNHYSCGSLWSLWFLWETPDLKHVLIEVGKILHPVDAEILQYG